MKHIGRLFWCASASLLFCGGVGAADSSGLLAVKLNTLWRIKIGSTYGLTATPQDLQKVVVDTALGYVAASSQDLNGNPLQGVKPLYRLVNNSALHADDMEATSIGEGGYSERGILGYLWTQQAAYPGMVELLRVYDATGGSVHAGSHSLLAAGDSLHKTEAPNGYSVEGSLGYAYPRYLSAEVLVPVSGGGVTVKSNANAGGAVWEWWWMGKEFINDFDYGRQLSMAVYCETGQALQEAGDKYGNPTIPVYARHPSPTLYVRNSSTNRQSTRAIPVEWTPDEHGGGKDNAVIYANAKIGKELTLDWRGPDNVDRQWSVALYESVYEGPSFTVANVEAPTAYLNPEFSNYYKYDPKSDTLTPVTANHSKVNISGGGADGLIIAAGPGPDAIAMGVYKNDPNAGIVLYDDSGPSDGHYGPHFSKWGIVYRSALSPQWRFRSWIVTDRVKNIQKDFHQLYIWGVTSRDLKTDAGK
jgi:hypothetical protein